MACHRSVTADHVEWTFRSNKAVAGRTPELELVENLAGSGEYHCMPGNFLKYAGPLTWNDSPVDAHS
jgi:hypothetical protein